MYKKELQKKIKQNPSTALRMTFCLICGTICSGWKCLYKIFII